MVGVEGLVGTDHAVPPAETASGAAVAILCTEAIARALRRRRLREARRVRVAAQRMADENHVVARRRQRAVRLVRDPDRMQRASAVERERRRKIQEPRFNRADRAGGSF
jgi:hypothetical protein